MGMDRDERRRKLEEFYDGLSPEERRQRIVLNPVFRSAYNRVSQAHRQFPIPAYLWERWVPELGLLPVAVYVELRRMCFVNDATGERRTVVWPKQETLAKRLGVKKRHTISAALQVLEAHGFIERARTSYNDKATGRIRRGVTEYDVMWEFPLLPADAVEVLIEETSPGLPDHDGTLRAEKRPFGSEPVDNSHRRAEKRPSNRAEKRPCETLPRTITSTLTNVESKTSKEGEGALRGRTEMVRSSRAVRAKREALAQEVGDSLHRMAGNGTTELHKSAGFHRRVCRLMPEHLVRVALAATRDAIDREKTGHGRLTRGPAAYFAGAVKKLAEEHGVDLQLKPSEPAPRMPVKASVRPAGATKSRGETKEPDQPRMSPEEVREGLRKLMASLGSKVP
jgi:hypothetical protein